MRAGDHEAAGAPVAPTRRLYLIRHGEAEPVTPDGPLADPWMAPLSARGRGQAGALAEALGTIGLDLLVTSTVPRAVETGAILARRAGLVPIAEAGLDELRPGRVLAGSPEAVRRAVRLAYHDAGKPGARFLDGEPFAAFALRVEGALAGLLARPRWARAAIVTHEPALRLALARCQGLGLAELAAFEAATGSVSVLACPPGTVALDAATVLLANATAEQAARLP
jgi:probable phosphoglycerate mutase